MTEKCILFNFKQTSSKCEVDRENNRYECYNDILDMVQKIAKKCEAK